MSTDPNRQQVPWLISEQDIPKPGLGELLVKIKATALNPVDWKIMASSQLAAHYCSFLAQILLVTRRKLFQGLYKNDNTGFQQYMVADATMTARSKLSYKDASTIPVALTISYLEMFNTNYSGLKFTGPLEPSQQGQLASTPFIILGGSSSVRQYIIQLVKVLGVTHIIDCTNTATLLHGKIKKIANTLIKHVYDAISSQETQQFGHDLLVPGGQLNIVLPQKITKVDDKTILYVTGIQSIPKHHELLEEGGIIPNRYEVLLGGLGGITEGYNICRMVKYPE
ncbi:hypothetical protein L208DRAFT_1421564 [Tricholoma matsutake]|nr:hypothetical protein L208DRAFT_1421564 [Tricholoma matsutake 945]